MGSRWVSIRCIGDIGDIVDMGSWGHGVTLGLHLLHGDIDGNGAQGDTGDTGSHWVSIRWFRDIGDIEGTVDIGDMGSHLISIHWFGGHWGHRGHWGLWGHGVTLDLHLLNWEHWGH